MQGGPRRTPPPGTFPRKAGRHLTSGHFADRRDSAVGSRCEAERAAPHRPGTSPRKRLRGNPDGPSPAHVPRAAAAELAAGAGRGRDAPIARHRSRGNVSAEIPTAPVQQRFRGPKQNRSRKLVKGGPRRTPPAGPSPRERLRGDPDGPTPAEVPRTAAEPESEARARRTSPHPPAGPSPRDRFRRDPHGPSPADVPRTEPEPESEARARRTSPHPTSRNVPAGTSPRKPRRPQPGG